MQDYLNRIPKRERILEVALRLFAEKGFKDTSMSELSQVTDAAEWGIFYHFSSSVKHRLVLLDRCQTW